VKQTERTATTAARLREAMDEANKKQIDLSKITGLSHSTISRYLSGQVEPRQEATHKLAAALDVSEMWLWGYDVPKARTPEQKNNDILADIVVRLRTDGAFFSTVGRLYELDAQQLAGLDQLLSAFKK